jgi:hypothetical protein
VESGGFPKKRFGQVMPVPASGLELMTVGAEGDGIAAVIAATFGVFDDVVDFKDRVTIVGVTDGAGAMA